MGFLDLIGGIKGIAVIAIILALGGYVWKTKHDAGVLEQQIVTLTAQRDEAGTARDQALAANATNLEAINQLKAEKLATNTALNNLEAARVKDQVTIGTLRASIRAQASNPLNQTKLSPVLSDTIRAIQAERIKRAQLLVPEVTAK